MVYLNLFLTKSCRKIVLPLFYFNIKLHYCKLSSSFLGWGVEFHRLFVLVLRFNGLFVSIILALP